MSPMIHCNAKGIGDRTDGLGTLSNPYQIVKPLLISQPVVALLQRGLPPATVVNPFGMKTPNRMPDVDAS